MTVAGRLGQIRKILGLSQKDMGRRVGVSGTTWQNYELENAAPNAHVLARLSGEGFDMNWVLTGAGTMRTASGTSNKPEAPAAPAKGLAELAPAAVDTGDGRHVAIPRYTLRAIGTVTAAETAQDDRLAFRRDFIETMLKADPATLIAIEVTDDSMWPTFGPGDILLADTAEPRLRGSGIYAFASGATLMVKRLQAKLDGDFIVTSDNSERYPPEEIERTALDRVKIVGRVIWRGGRL